MSNIAGESLDMIGGTKNTAPEAKPRPFRHTGPLRPTIERMAMEGATPTQIAKVVKKSQSYVSTVLTRLRKAGLPIPNHEPGRPSLAVIVARVPAIESIEEDRVRQEMVKRCARHLADLEAVYQRPTPKVTPEGLPRPYRTGLAEASFCGSPSAMLADFG